VTTITSQQLAFLNFIFYSCFMLLTHCRKYQQRALKNSRAIHQNKTPETELPFPPPWSATLPLWWGFALMTRKISKIWRWGAN